MAKQKHTYDQIVFLLQGGGALGSYQVGVCQALLEHGIEPDWIVGTSIGAINGAIIAGNPPEERIKKMHDFWDTISSPLPSPPFVDNNDWQEFFNFWSAQGIALFGVPGFFKPRIVDPWLLIGVTPDKISYYDTSELRGTLLKFIDFDYLNEKRMRLTLGAVSVKTGKAVRFDNFRQTITPEHVMASGALPPGFPAIKIDNEYYWDGGISSNTPFGVVLQERIPKKLLCFIVNLYSYIERLPSSMIDVTKAKKEIEFSSRHNELLKNYCEIHFLQNVIESLSTSVSNNKNLNEAIERIKCIGHPTALNIVRFHYLDRPSDLWSEDYNFSKSVLNAHWKSGYEDAQKALKKPTWIDSKISNVGVVIHEF